MSAANRPLDEIGSTKPKLPHNLGLTVARSQSENNSQNEKSIGSAPVLQEPQSAAVEMSSDRFSNDGVFSDRTLPDSPTFPPAPLTGARDRFLDHVEERQDGLGALPLIRNSDHNVGSISLALRGSVSSDDSGNSVGPSASSKSSSPSSAASLALPDRFAVGLSAKFDKNASTSVSEPPGQPTPLQARRTAKSFSRPNYAKPLDISRADDLLPEPQGLDHRSAISPRDRSFSPPERQLSQMSPYRPTPTSARPESPREISPRFPGMVNIPNRPPISSRPIRRPTTPGFKGNCKGCGDAILGKSVSSADGRLTGRYHKQCFVCQTCREPFATADFYVIDNHPYCARHYHTLNGSLCKECDRGIEGPYMETDAKQKFHPHCFKCKVRFVERKPDQGSMLTHH